MSNPEISGAPPPYNQQQPGGFNSPQPPMGHPGYAQQPHMQQQQPVYYQNPPAQQIPYGNPPPGVYQQPHRPPAPAGMYEGQPEGFGQMPAGQQAMESAQHLQSLQAVKSCWMPNNF